MTVSLRWRVSRLLFALVILNACASSLGGSPKRTGGTRAEEGR
jgi:hypothetical protein